MQFLHKYFSAQLRLKMLIRFDLIKILIMMFFIQSIGLVDSFAQEKNQIKKDFVRMGALANMVTGVELKDADAAFRIWTDILVKKFKSKDVYDFKFEYKMYDNINDLKNDINRGLINYFNVSVQDYFQLDLGEEFIPFLSGTNHSKEKFTQYYLVTTTPNSANDLKVLSGKKINMSKSISNTIGSTWMKTLLRDELGAILYKSINIQTVNDNENEDLLAVFFNKANYALVSQSSYDLACELNPSIKKKVVILRSSGHLLSGVFMYRKGMNQNTIKAIKDIVSDLHNDNEGRQILNLFKISKIVSITSDDLFECEKVINKYYKYIKK